jgi:hypothetical protein
VTGRIHDRLVDAFGDDSVFKDVGLHAARCEFQDLS